MSGQYLTDVAWRFELGRLPDLTRYTQPVSEPYLVVEVVLLRVASAATWRPSESIPLSVQGAPPRRIWAGHDLS